ncbi:MAG: response regulator [Alphaproteobacteria bacterium]|nr:response regulator [Alphaproteobacteria bacterium]
MTGSVEVQHHLLVVDDDRRLRDLLRRYLTEHGFRVTTASDAAAARAQMRAFDFDLLVVDVMMPGENGRDFSRGLRREHEVPILLLTAMGEIEDRVAGLESGADDYLVKPFEPRELVLRIAAILRRARAPAPAPAAPLRLGACLFDAVRAALTRDGIPVRLTPAEAALLAALARQPGSPVKREVLAQQARLRSRGRTIDVQVNRLRRKVEPDPKAPRYIRTVWGEGYMLVPDS